jgi:hypothetical protein
VSRGALQPFRHDPQRAPAPDPELLVIVRGEVQLGIADVLARAVRDIAVNHAPVVVIRAQARAHDEPELDESVEAREIVEPLELGKSTDGERDMVRLCHCPEGLCPDGAFEVQVKLGLGEPGDQFIHWMT